MLYEPSVRKDGPKIMPEGPELHKFFASFYQEGALATQ